jgi:DNA-binding transcriptional MerR regulator
MTIGELASRSRVPPRTIRFYEAKGILPLPRRSGAGYRLYEPADLKRLVLVRRARSLGFSLSEAATLVGLAEHERCDSFQGQAAQLLVARLAEVDAAIERLNETRRELRETLEGYTGADCQQAALQCGCDCLCLGT